MKKTVRLMDVAKLAGVGVGTASRVINNHPSVRDDKRQRVLDAIQKLDYQCNEIARSLKANRTKTVGVLIPDIANEFYADVVRGIEDAASSQGYTYLLSSTDSNTEKELTAINIMREKQVDGIVLLSHTAAPELLHFIESNALDAVLVASTSGPASIASVNIDNRQAAYEAVCHLAQLGHTRIAMVCGPQNDQSGGVDRMKGYRQALEQHHLPFGEETLAVGVNYTVKAGYDCTCRLLSRRPRPTAIFLASDYMAIGAVRAAEEQGLRVPQQLSVLGFDNLSVAEYFTPALTTVNQPRYRMGLEAMKLLFELIRGNPSAQRKLLLPHELVVRNSTTPLSQYV